jgi:hypothetical protein
MCTKVSSVCGRGSITATVAPAKVITASIAEAWRTALPAIVVHVRGIRWTDVGDEKTDVTG